MIALPPTRPTVQVKRLGRFEHRVTYGPGIVGYRMTAWGARRLATRAQRAIDKDRGKA